MAESPIVTNTNEPTVFYAGDTVSWRKTLPDYPANNGWVMKYDVVREGTLFNLTATADGIDHIFRLYSSETSTYPPGEYMWRSYVIKNGLKFSISSGFWEVKPDFAQQTNGFDYRSTAKRVVDALEAILSGDESATNILIVSQSCGDLNISRKSDVYNELQRWRLMLKMERERFEQENGRGKKNNQLLIKFV